jgi:hypothetical protein
MWQERPMSLVGEEEEKEGEERKKIEDDNPAGAL